MTRSRLVDCDDCAIRRLCSSRPFSAEELDAVKAFKSGDIVLDEGSEIVGVDAESVHLWTLYSGLAHRSVSLSDGRRQILNILFPGDFIGLHGSLFDPIDHAVTALTNVQLCVFEKARLMDVFRRAPDLGYSITWVSAYEHAFVDLNLVAVGKFRADQRVAFLLLSYFERMRVLERTQGQSCEFPLRQQHIADSLGLSLPYTNDALRRLTREGLIAIRDGRLEIGDWDAFSERAVVAPRLRTPFRFV